MLSHIHIRSCLGNCYVMGAAAWLFANRGISLHLRYRSVRLVSGKIVTGFFQNIVQIYRATGVKRHLGRVQRHISGVVVTACVIVVLVLSIVFMAMLMAVYRSHNCNSKAKA